ncbi:retinoic acid-induced protein 2 [Erinaceus europaeus]|uniref:Retinoic acid-induced protein 2 n=1 Tax=Erinaceus europaeus TaxID=9365 RepID=A0A1S3APZ5_ERIEU|nr:retinoic acid-induced protein 2 [Erinaceus europaeus]XP_060038951.1 retinoic acid-induced protein 2 [Erinaceus europaeus]XP_060038952.1 retinoic acid-induced protein 2 [Erinaceus europaeus]XP_060038953.1 retinoic acid-induced protein 2 [Erinaceus europaeus]XP_060038954.1 retinoic acid-induced protein 2 [Erinaceus europaeus]XP_060038955.1 retinoic acid-induced protein 2 [Erinaceus europaeus]XP_060038956.1 retinoic acid-induced protein 2 [Erinaceus europaeus]XP_060038957.1 retinoic acid-ind
MDELQSQNLSMDMAESTPALASNRLENGMAQLITTEAWNINSTDLVKKALVAVPAPSILNPPAESQSGMALKVAATVLQPLCLGESPVVMPIHMQVEGGSAPELNPSSNATYVMTAQGPVQLPVVLEQHVFQHLNSPLVLPQETPCSSGTMHNNLFQGPEDPEPQPQLLDLRIPSQPQEPTLPFEAVLQNLFPSQGALAPPPCQPPPGYATAAPQPFNSPLSPLVPPATLLVPYPVIVPLPVPVPIPIPIPVPQSSESKFSPSCPKPPTSFGLHPFKGTQAPLEKELKPFDLLQPREYFQLSRHTVIKMGSENEALDLSMKSVPWLKAGETSPPLCQEDTALDLSLAAHRKLEPPPQAPVASLGRTGMEKLPRAVETPFATATTLEAMATATTTTTTMLDGRTVNSSPAAASAPEQPNQPCSELKAESSTEAVSESQATKVIVSVEDAVPTIFCGKIKGLSGVSTKNFSFKREDSVLQGYGINSQGEESLGSVEALRKPVKNRSIKLKKVNSQEIHMLPIKKQRLATFFPRK